MESFNWPVAVTILGAIIVIASFLTTIFKKDEPWKKDILILDDKLNKEKNRVNSILSDEKQNNNQRFTIQEQKAEAFIRELEMVKRDLEKESESQDKANEKLEEKVEKLTDIMINFIKEHNRKD